MVIHSATGRCRRRGAHQGNHSFPAALQGLQVITQDNITCCHDIHAGDSILDHWECGCGDEGYARDEEKGGAYLSESNVKHKTEKLLFFSTSAGWLHQQCRYAKYQDVRDRASVQQAGGAVLDVICAYSD